MMGMRCMMRLIHPPHQLTQLTVESVGLPSWRVEPVVAQPIFPSASRSFSKFLFCFFWIFFFGPVPQTRWQLSSATTRARSVHGRAMTMPQFFLISKNRDWRLSSCSEQTSRGISSIPNTIAQTADCENIDLANCLTLLVAW